MEVVLFQEKPSEIDSVMRHLSPIDRSLCLVTKVATLIPLQGEVHMTLPGIGSHAMRRTNAFTAATGATSTRIQSASI